MPKFKSILVACVAIAAVFSGTGCMSTPDGGEIQVIRNDGPWDNKKIRQVVCPGSGNTWTGWLSNEHGYPDSTSQRIWKFSDDEDADTSPITGLRTKDGVLMTLKGTLFFKTAFDCTEAGQRLVKAFDDANVNRPEGQRPWEDWDGWLNSQFKPIIDANARDIALGLNAKEVVSSAALLAREGEVTDEDVENADNKSNVAAIEEAMASGLEEQLREKLGEDFFTDITFNMEQPSLPEVDDAIADAQRAFARVADVRAERLKQEEQVKVERQKKLQAVERQAGYVQCPSCARQDELRALPNGLLVLGGGANLNLNR